jgi:type II secretory pathway predicted ATPase ExeA
MKKSAQKLPTISPLQAFRLRHGLSYQDLSDVCGSSPNCSKSQMSRLLNNQIDDSQMESEIRQILAQNLPAFLFQKGLTSTEIDQQLSEIFTEKEYQKMISARTTLTRQTQQWFGFSDDPFALIPQSRDEIFVSPELKVIFNRVVDAMKYQHFIAITGEIGSGKTTLRMMIEDYLLNHPDLKLIVPETFDMSKVTASAIMREMLEDLGEFKLPRSPVAQAKMLKRVIVEKSSNYRISLLFDEIHRVNEFTLPTLKNFWEMLRQGFSRYLGIVLLGQPQFEAELNKMPEIKERLEVIQMPKFQASAIDYLRHRIALVGGDADTLFDPESLEMIARQANTPLALGNVANTALNLTRFDAKEKQVFASFLRSEPGFGNSATATELRKRRAA